MSIYSVIPALLTALIAFLVYRYRNRIGYSVITIEGRIEDDDGLIKVSPLYRSVKAERLKLKNYGYRNLEAVELHFTMSEKPAALSIRDTSSLSDKSVVMEWADRTLKINLANLPSGETIEIDLVRVGHYEPTSGRLRGTGGRYKIVRMELQEMKRSLMYWGAFALVGIGVPAIGLWLDNQTPVAQPQPAPAIKLAPAGTKG